MKYLGDHIKGKGLSLKLNSSAIFDIIEDQAEEFQNFKTTVKSEWDIFKQHNQNRIIKRTYTAFFYQNFHHYFKSFINDFCGFNEKSLLLLIKEKVSDDNLFLEYTYSLSEEEERNFYNLSKKLEDQLDGTYQIKFSVPEELKAKAKEKRLSISILFQGRTIWKGVL